MALQQLMSYYGAGGQNVLNTWAASGPDPCSALRPWQGVSCTAGQVTSLALPGKNLFYKTNATVFLSIGKQPRPPAAQAALLSRSGNGCVIARCCR